MCKDRRDLWGKMGDLVGTLLAIVHQYGENRRFLLALKNHIHQAQEPPTEISGKGSKGGVTQ